MAKSYNLLNKLTTNKKFVTNLVNNYKKQVSASNPDINKTQEACTNLCRGIFVILENTDAKKDFIDGYNARLNSSVKDGKKKIDEVIDPGRYYDIKKSDEYEFINYKFQKNEDGSLSYKDKADQMFKQNRNNDVVVEGFKKAIYPDKSGKYNFEFSKIFCGDILNRISHYVINHQNKIKNSIFFKDGPLNAVDFEKKLTAIDTLKKSSAEYYFESSNIMTYLDDLEKNAEKPRHKEDYDTFVKILKSVFPNQTINKKFITAMNECYNDKELIDILFEGKSLTIVDLWITQCKIKKLCEAKGLDPYEENKLSYRTDLIVDDKKTPKDEKTYRICMSLQSEYDDLIKSNTGYVYAPNYIEYLSKKYKATKLEIEKSLSENAKKLKMPIVKDYEDNSIKDQANMTVFHLTQDFVNSYKGKHDLSFVRESDNPYLKRTSFRSSNFLTPYSKRKATLRIDNHILEDVLDNCFKNENKYGDNYDKMNKDFDLEKCIEKEFEVRSQGGN